jgi:hypothetical protein
VDFTKLQKQNIRVQRALSALLVALSAAACSTLPDSKFEKHSFPDNAFVGDVKDRPYITLGQVKARVDFQSLDPGHDEGELCRNYYNKATRELLKTAKDKGADAIINLESVVFYEDGKLGTYPTPECSDDGQEGQILVQAIAIKWGEAFTEPSPEKFRAFQLKVDEDGIDGGIRILAGPTRVALFTMDRKLLDEKPVDASKAWLTSEFILSAEKRTILINEELGDEVSSKLLALQKRKLDAQAVLVQGRHSAWKITTRLPHDLLQVTSVRAPKDTVNYTRYHFADDQWVKSVRSEDGQWDSSHAFPREDKFPPGSYLSK